MRNLLIRCYPAAWRVRDADEFTAVLEDRPLGPFDVADVLLGALDAQLHLRGRGAASSSPGMMERDARARRARLQALLESGGQAGQGGDAPIP